MQLAAALKSHAESGVSTMFIRWHLHVPSGELTFCHGKIHHFSWENPLFLWPFSIAMLVHQRVPHISRLMVFSYLLFSWYPLVIYHSYWKLPFSSLMYPPKKKIHSYVSLPEGSSHIIPSCKKWRVDDLNWPLHNTYRCINVSEYYLAWISHR